jgi:hypothetical protein
MGGILKICDGNFFCTRSPAPLSKKLRYFFIIAVTNRNCAKISVEYFIVNGWKVLFRIRAIFQTLSYLLRVIPPKRLR